jgi:hypothetical protein
MGYSVELSRRVYDNKHGVCFEIAPDSDGLDCVQLRTPDAGSKEYFGDVRFTVPKEMAILIGQALIDAAKEAESRA